MWHENNFWNLKIKNQSVLSVIKRKKRKIIFEIKKLKRKINQDYCNKREKRNLTCYKQTCVIKGRKKNNSQILKIKI